VMFFTGFVKCSDFLQRNRRYYKTSAFLHFSRNYGAFLHEFLRKIQTKE
jgi:hypothetical protein